MKELGREAFDRAGVLFQPLSRHLIVASMLNADSAGRIFADDASDLSVVFAESPKGFFLAGRWDREVFNAGLVARLRDELVPAAEESWAVDVYFHPDGWRGEFGRLFDIDEPLIFPASFCRIDRPPVIGPCELPDNFALVPVD